MSKIWSFNIVINRNNKKIIDLIHNFTHVIGLSGILFGYTLIEQKNLSFSLVRFSRIDRLTPLVYFAWDKLSRIRMKVLFAGINFRENGRKTRKRETFSPRNFLPVKYDMGLYYCWSCPHQAFFLGKRSRRCWRETMTMKYITVQMCSCLTPR